MTQAFGIILLIVALVVHEAGHAIAMARRGVEIEEAGIGFPIGKLKLLFHPRWAPFPIVVGIVPLGAYVRLSERGLRQLNAMSYKDQAICYSAGVIINLVFGGALMAFALAEAYVLYGVRSLTALWISLGAVALVITLRRPLSLIMPLIGTASLIWIVSVIAHSFSDVTGPAGTVVYVAHASSSWTNALLTGGAVSIALAQFNALPLFPLDGGRVMKALIETRGLKRVSTVFQVGTALAFVCFFAVMIIHDFL